jgi:hypothetical protein
MAFFFSAPSLATPLAPHGSKQITTIILQILLKVGNGEGMQISIVSCVNKPQKEVFMQALIGVAPRI